MKYFYTLIGITLLSAVSFAQAPDKMSFQAVVRNASNGLVVSSPVGMKISILQGSVSGSAIYAETQTPTSNTNGLVSVEIGSGTVVTGDFSTIDWVNGPYFIKTETDPTGGTNYTISGTTQLLSVPYALFAKTAENVTNDMVNDADADPTNEIQTLSQTGNTISLSNGGGSVTVTDTDTHLTEAEVDNYVSNNGYLTAEVDDSNTNELQTLSQTGNTISLSNGGGSVTVTDTDTHLTEAEVDNYVSNNGYPTAVDNLRIIQGTIGQDGTILSGTGFTVEKTAVGNYKITFNAAFTNYPAVTYSTNYYANFVLSNILSGSSVSVIIKNASGTDVDPNVWFSFIAMGPK